MDGDAVSEMEQEWEWGEDDDPAQRQIDDLMAEAMQLSEALELAPDAAIKVCEDYRREHGYEQTTDELIAAVRSTLRGDF